MLIKLNGKEYQVNNNEFEHIPHERYSNLLIRKDKSIDHFTGTHIGKTFFNQNIFAVGLI